MIQFTIEDGLLAALEYYKIHPENYKPAYNGESVGLDLYNASSERIIVPPSKHVFDKSDYEQVLINTGLRVLLPPNHQGQIWQRGSIIKTPLIHRAGLIDPGYKGIIFIPVVNLSNDFYTIPPYGKLPFQLVVTSTITQYCYISRETYEEHSRHSKRKENCLGSTN